MVFNHAAGGVLCERTFRCSLKPTREFSTHLAPSLLHTFWPCNLSQAPLGAREVVLLGGDVHEGGWTRIKHLEDADGVNYERDHVQQLTASAMSYHLRSGMQQIVSAGTKNTGHLMASHFAFRHYEWSSLCNYGILTCFRGEHGEATYVANLVCGGRECYERSFSHADYEPTFGENMLFELRDVFSKCTVQ